MNLLTYYKIRCIKTLEVKDDNSVSSPTWRIEFLDKTCPENSIHLTEEMLHLAMSRLKLAKEADRKEK